MNYEIKILCNKCFTSQFAKMLNGVDNLTIYVDPCDCQGKEELLFRHCGFCGHNAPSKHWIKEKDGNYWVQCAGCGCRGPYYENRNKAVMAWNMRK